MYCKVGRNTLVCFLNKVKMAIGPVTLDFIYLFKSEQVQCLYFGKPFSLE